MTGAAPITLYFHGLPGSRAELTGFGPAIAAATRAWQVVDRSNGFGQADYFEALARRIEAAYPRGSLRFVGFSLGAAAALRAATHLDGRIERIELVSPAAPLELGDFLPGMAGAPVFRAARAGSLPFALLTGLQASVTRFAPQRMASSLMAKARGGDAALGADPVFLASLAQSLRQSLISARTAYSTEIVEYVQPWQTELSQVQSSVRIWHGTDDDWTPPAMAKALQAFLPNCAGVEWCEGLSHFSTLRAYLSERAP